MIVNPVVFESGNSGPLSDLKHIGHVSYVSNNWRQGDARFSIEVDEPWVNENAGKNVVVYGLYAGAYYDDMMPVFKKSNLSETYTGITFKGSSGNDGSSVQDMAYVSWNVRNNVLRINVNNEYVENNPSALVTTSGNCVYFSLDFYLVE